MVGYMENIRKRPTTLAAARPSLARLLSSLVFWRPDKHGKILGIEAHTYSIHTG